MQSADDIVGDVAEAAVRRKPLSRDVGAAAQVIPVEPSVGDSRAAMMNPGP